VRYTLSITLNDLTVRRHTWRKTRVNCAVLTRNSAKISFPVVFHTDNCAVHSGYSVHSAYEHRLIYSFFLLHILRFNFFFSDNIMADVASKQQTTALFLSTIVTRTRTHTQNWQKNWQTWWETCAVPENIQFSFSCSFFKTVKLHSLTVYSIRQHNLFILKHYKQGYMFRLKGL